VLFGALGTVVGIYAETFDHHTFINNIVILPLTFVGVDDDRESCGMVMTRD